MPTEQLILYIALLFSVFAFLVAVVTLLLFVTLKRGPTGPTGYPGPQGLQGECNCVSDNREEQ